MLVVDAYNVLHVVGVLPPDLAGLEPPGLARLIGVSRWRNEEAHLVCDGAAPLVREPIGEVMDRGAARIWRIEDAPRVSIVHVGVGRDADTFIEELLEKATAPRRMTIVSNDRRLRGAARRRKARWLSSEDFLRQLASDHAASPTRLNTGPADPASDMDQAAVKRWLKTFGFDPALADRRDPPPVKKEAPRRDAQDPPEPGPAERKPLEEDADLWRAGFDPDDLDMDKWLGSSDNPSS